MTECAWCGVTDLALYGDGEWAICKRCEHLAAVTERRARPNAQLMARHRDILIARNVCYFCSTRIDTTTFGASGPNVNICATCLAAARAYHEVP